MIYEGDTTFRVASRFSKAFEFFCIVMRVCLVIFFSESVGLYPSMLVDWEYIWL